MILMDPIELGLPHREPFLFVDAVTAHDPGQSASGVKRFCGDEAFFAGHFPGDPIVPGVILTEALAQIAGIAGSTPGSPGFLLTAVRSMKFTSAVRPGQAIILEATKRSELGGLTQFDVIATVGNEPVASGMIVLSERGR